MVRVCDNYYARRSMIYYNCHRMQAVTPRARTDEPSRRAFGELEQQVLSVLWAADAPLVPREVQERLVDPPAYTTVMTILDRLQRKDLATRTSRGRAFAYEAVVSESAMAAQHARALLANGHDRRAVLQGFVDVLSEDDSAELTRLLRKAQGARQPGRDATERASLRLCAVCLVCVIAVATARVVARRTDPALGGPHIDGDGSGSCARHGGGTLVAGVHDRGAGPVRCLPRALGRVGCRLES